MGFFIHKKEKYIVENIKKHVDLVVETVKEFLQALIYCIEEDREKSRYYTKRTHEREKVADQYLREINKEIIITFLLVIFNNNIKEKYIDNPDKIIVFNSINL